MTTLLLLVNRSDTSIFAKSLEHFCLTCTMGPAAQARAWFGVNGAIVLIAAVTSGAARLTEYATAAECQLLQVPLVDTAHQSVIRNMIQGFTLSVESLCRSLGNLVDLANQTFPPQPLHFCCYLLQ